MSIHLTNTELSVLINPLGAELCSVICNRTGHEYMWQADPQHWGRHAPILFPFVGETAGRKVTYDDREAAMQRHGFARTSLFELVSMSDDKCIFVLNQNEQTLSVYPFFFRFELLYRLEARTVHQTFRVTNTGQWPMGFQVGGHPAFALPLDEGRHFIAFDQDIPLQRHLLSSDGLYTGQTRRVPTPDGRLWLEPGLFDEDAIVLKDSGMAEATLATTSGSRAIKVRFSGFPMLGIWSVPATPFVCIEPWFGCADKVDGTGRLWDKEGLMTIGPSEIFEASFSMEFMGQ